MKELCGSGSGSWPAGQVCIPKKKVFLLLFTLLKSESSEKKSQNGRAIQMDGQETKRRNLLLPFSSLCKCYEEQQTLYFSNFKFQITDLPITEDGALGLSTIAKALPSCKLGMYEDLKFTGVCFRLLPCKGSSGFPSATWVDKVLEALIEKSATWVFPSTVLTKIDSNRKWLLRTVALVSRAINLIFLLKFKVACKDLFELLERSFKVVKGVWTCITWFFFLKMKLKTTHWAISQPTLRKIYISRSLWVFFTLFLVPNRSKNKLREPFNLKGIHDGLDLIGKLKWDRKRYGSTTAPTAAAADVASATTYVGPTTGLAFDDATAIC